MKPVFLFLLLGSFSMICRAQPNDTSDIKKVLDDQVLAWNRGSVDDFMKGYWNHDSLVFVGKNGISYGYKNALNNYKKNYNDQAHMGKLFFTLLKMKRLSPDYYFIIGKWFLKRSLGDLGGSYTLLFRKISGKWVIVSDHTS
jgi:ketosteroid isomerase-like protein